MTTCEKDPYGRCLNLFVKDLENALTRRLSEDEINRIKEKAPSLAMLEAFSNEYYFSDDAETIIAQLC